MLATYKAVLKDDHLEWSEAAPDKVARDKAVAVYVTVLDEPLTIGVESSQGQRMAAALEKIAATHALADIDPLIWERDQRQDRSLPGRLV